MRPLDWNSPRIGASEAALALRHDFTKGVAVLRL
jgi:hypothetical protein